MTHLGSFERRGPCDSLWLITRQKPGAVLGPAPLPVLGPSPAVKPALPREPILWDSLTRQSHMHLLDISSIWTVHHESRSSFQQYQEDLLSSLLSLLCLRLYVLCQVPNRGNDVVYICL